MKRMVCVVLIVLMAFGACAAARADTVMGVIKTPSYDGSVNVRAGAGVNQPIVSWAKNGWSVEILYYGNTWHKIRVMNTGKVGWVSANYVRVTGGGYTPDPAPSPSYSGNATVSTRYASSVVNVRHGPGTYYAVVTGVKNGAVLNILAQEGSWYQVYVPSKNVTGWISSAYVRRNTSARTTGDVNLRYGPGTGYGRVTVIKKGQSITILSVGDGWSQVSYNGMTGYISNKYWMYY